MTDLRKAAEKALHALEDPNRDKHIANTNDAINSLRQALAQPEQVITPISPDQYEQLCGTCGACTGKPWVGLTLNDITGCMCDCADDDGTYKTSCFIDYAKAIEQKLKNLNT